MVRTVASPWGPLGLRASERGLCEVRFGGLPAEEGPGHAHLARAELELARYVREPGLRFEVPLDLEGTPFQQAVWALVREVAPGTLASYGELAKRLGKPGASRAVGAANGANPVPIIVPCHRVIGSDGSLTGYGGGLELKRALLRHEERVLVLR